MQLSCKLNTYTHGQLIFTRVGNHSKGNNTLQQIRTTGYVHANKVRLYLIPCTEFLKMDPVTHMWAEIYKLLKENYRVNLHDFEFSNRLLDMTPTGEKMEFIKMMLLCIKGHYQQSEKVLYKWEKICANHRSDESSIQNIRTELLQHNSKKTNNYKFRKRNWQSTWIDVSPKKICKWLTTVRTGHGTKDWFQIGKGVHQGCILSPCLFNLYAEYIMRNAGLEEAQAGIKIAGRNINNLSYADDTTLMAESEKN